MAPRQARQDRMGVTAAHVEGGLRRVVDGDEHHRVADGFTTRAPRTATRTLAAPSKSLIAPERSANGGAGPCRVPDQVEESHREPESANAPACPGGGCEVAIGSCAVEHLAEEVGERDEYVVSLRAPASVNGATVLEAKGILDVHHEGRDGGVRDAGERVPITRVNCRAASKPKRSMAIAKALSSSTSPSLSPARGHGGMIRAARRGGPLRSHPHRRAPLPGRTLDLDNLVGGRPRQRARFVLAPGSRRGGAESLQKRRSFEPVAPRRARSGRTRLPRSRRRDRRSASAGAAACPRPYAASITRMLAMESAGSSGRADRRGRAPRRLAAGGRRSNRRVRARSAPPRPSAPAADGTSAAGTDSAPASRRGRRAHARRCSRGSPRTASSVAVPCARRQSARPPPARSTSGERSVGQPRRPRARLGEEP